MQIKIDNVTVNTPYEEHTYGNITVTDMDKMIEDYSELDPDWTSMVITIVNVNKPRA